MIPKLLSKVFVYSTLLMATGTALAGEYFEKNGVALQGYDPVAYFVAGKPQKGAPEHSYSHKGSKFYFASAENQRMFAMDPEKYAPQYGGFCAFGAAKGVKASTQPDAFSVVDGKLYLNNSKKVHKMWEQDIPGNITEADRKWPEVAKTALKD